MMAKLCTLNLLARMKRCLTMITKQDELFYAMRNRTQLSDLLKKELDNL